jgi:hypothetical protein
VKTPTDVLRLEREAMELAARVAALERRHAGTEQQALAQWYNPWWAGPPPAPAGNCSVTARVLGCNATGVPSCTVTVKNASTGAVYVVMVTGADGRCSGECTIPADNTAAKVAYTPGDPYAARFAVQSEVSVNLRLLPTTTTVPNKTLTADTAAGWHCSGMAYFPLSATLHMTDSMIGSTTLTWSLGGWGGTISYNYPGCPAQGCPAVSGLVVSFDIAGGSTNLGGNCTSVNGICPANGGTAPQHPGRGVIMTMTQASPFQASGQSTTTTDALYCSSSAITRTLTE